MICPFCLSNNPRFLTIDDDGVTRYECPEARCGQPIPAAMVESYATHPPIVFSLIGLSGHGKTCYLAGLLQEFEQVGASWPKFLYSPLDDNSMNEVKDKLRSLREGVLPEATTVAFPEPAILRMSGIPGIGRLQIYLYDNGGEAFADTLRLQQFAPYVTRSPVIVWLISLNDLAEPTELLQLLTVYRESLLAMRSDARRQSLVVVLTKADELGSLYDGADLPDSMRSLLGETKAPREGYPHDRLRQLSDDVERWLEEVAGQHNFVRLARETFASVRYCVASALGARPSGIQLSCRATPRGVLLPLYWLVDLQRPKVTVRTNAGTWTTYSLQEAVDSAPPGGRLELGAGAHELEAPLVVRLPIAMVGAADGETVVTCASGRMVLGVAGAPWFAAERISFVFKGDSWGNVVVASAGELKLLDCGFRGAKLAREKSPTGETSVKGGIGLKIVGETGGVVRNCVFTENQLSGVQVTDDAAPTLVANDCHNNDRAGISFVDRSGGAARRNALADNGHVGVVIGGSAEPVVTANLCEKNGSYGIAVVHDARPQIADNHCVGNPTGIRFADRASGLASRNECVGNSDAGISVCDEARPTLEGNQATGNGAAGIAYRDRAAGAARHNRCEGNRGDGFDLDLQAAPELTANECRDNAGNGLGFRGSASGTASGNLCLGNSADGIAVAADASPGLQDNDCSNNRGAGIAFRGRGGGSAVGNRGSGNGRSGLELADEAAPDLASNAFGPNTLGEFVDLRKSPAKPIWGFFNARKT